VEAASERFTRARHWAARLPSVFVALEREALPVLVVAAFAVAATNAVGSLLSQDGWLALVSGREVVRHGLPSLDHLTVWSAGRQWTDQQWLGQLTLYATYAVGGLRLLLMAHVALVVAAFALAIVAARRLGGSPRATALVAVGAFVPIISTTSAVRTQTMAALLFVLATWLLISESRAPSRRIYLVFPILVAWANIHGSVLLGASLSVLAALACAWERLRAPRATRIARWWTRPLVLVVGTAACAFASPYALSLTGYYRSTVFNGGFGKFVTEWRPTTFSGQDIPVFVIAGAGLWLLGRAGRRVSLFEKLAFLVVAAAAFDASRNVGWLGILSILVLPSTFDRTRTAVVQRRPSPVALGLVVAAVVGIGTAAVAAARGPGHALTARYPPRASMAVARALAANPRARVFADVRFADWLLWRDADARGRLMYDARLELLSEQQLEQLYRWSAEATDGWREAAAGASVAVVYRSADRGKVAALRRSGARLLYGDHEVAVLRLPPGFGRKPGF
jgi:hypothetical protein